jgi:sugar phosphate permease
VGVAVVVVGVSEASIASFFVGSMLAGVGFGAGFQGAVRTVVPFAAPHERAGVLSIIFIISYIAMGVPAVAAGWMIARHGNVVATAQLFSAIIVVLAGTALLAGGSRTLSNEVRTSLM